MSSTIGRVGAAAALLVSLATVSPAQPAAQSPDIEDPGWPREHLTADGDKVIFYQPQVESWADYEVLAAWSAVIVIRDSVSTPGAVKFTARTETNKDTRTVLFFDLQIQESRFPSVDSTQASRLTDLVASVIPEERAVALDRVLAYVEEESALDRARENPVSEAPPLIFYSDRPAILVLLDGEPILQKFDGTELAYAVNTNWNFFYHISDQRYYLLNDSIWLTSVDPGVGWRAASSLPADFEKIPADSNWIAVHQSLPLKAPQTTDLPRVFYTEEPAELIVTEGPAEFTPIPEADLLVVSNTDSDLFRNLVDNQYYFLVTGRWFRASSLDGPWSATTAELPESFREIPSDHDKASVRSSVPGTQEAEEAVILAQIPTTATIDKSKVTPPEVPYDGDPQFEQVEGIEGKEVAYAVNTADDVIRVGGDQYYLVRDGIWFSSGSPTGPWMVADSVPDEIYDIPPESPAHNVTYVYVYDSTPTHTTCGYTAGYMGVFFLWGVMVWGTGYWYPPYYRYGAPYYPVYWARPYTYGAAAWYNPWTGSYGRGGRYYGPYGGAAWGARYNPRTGTYARGAAAWGPGGATGWASAYNPRTGTGAFTQQSGNRYAQWGSSAVVRGDDWVRGGHYTTRRGTVRGIETSGGGQAVGISGNDGGRVVRSGEGDLYAGKDGNVYKRGNDGSWSELERDGSWGRVDQRDGARTPSDRAAADGARAASRDQGAWNSSIGRDLNRDSMARQQGNQRTSNYRTSRSSGFSRGGARAGGRRR